MAIIDSELQFFKSAVVTDTTSNGGLLSADLITTNVQQNVFPHVFKADRDAGDEKYRKIFAKVSNDDDDTLFYSTVWLDNPTIADDWIVMFAGTQTDTQNDIVGSEDKYGSGLLQTNVSASGQTIIVTVEDTTLTTGNDQIFRDGMTIGITNKATPDAVSGTTEFLTINGAPSVSGTDVTITTDEALANAYTVAEGTRVFGVMSLGDLVASASVVAEDGGNTGTGAFDDATYPVLPDNIGTISDTITVTFTDATNFGVVGANAGTLASGTTGVNYAPSNGDFTKPYFTIPYLGWGTGWLAGDIVTFTTIPAASPIWEKRVVPIGAASLSGNSCTIVFTGEAA